MTRVICTRAFRFNPPSGSDLKPAKASPLLITDLPSWVEKTSTFKSAVEAGAIKVMNTAVETKKVEKVQEGLEGTTKQQVDELEEAIVTPKKKKK